MAERQDVEINYCPTCRGVWIERGGLDKIIDRCAARVPVSRPPEARERNYEHDRDHDWEHDRGHDPDRRHRKSFLGDLFD